MADCMALAVRRLAGQCSGIVPTKERWECNSTAPSCDRCFEPCNLIISYMVWCTGVDHSWLNLLICRTWSSVVVCASLMWSSCLVFFVEHILGRGALMMQRQGGGLQVLNVWPCRFLFEFVARQSSRWWCGEWRWDSRNQGNMQQL